MELLELLLESLCDLLQPKLVLTLWLSFDGDWRRPPLLEQVMSLLAELFRDVTSTERPIPAHLAQLSSAVMVRVLAAFKQEVDAGAAATEQVVSLEETWRRRALVDDFMAKLEESPKKARALLEKTGLLQVIQLPSQPAGSGPPECGGDGPVDEFQDWARKLVWIFRCLNHKVPYAAMGEFFGQNKEDSEHAFGAFVDTFDWGKADIEQALRSLLEAFLLPKEAQQIDRVLKIFAHCYFKKHVDQDDSEGSNYLKHPDAAYTFAFSVILLNSDQHNPKLKKRMTVKDFLNNNRGINEGENIPTDVQSRIFESIRENEITTPSSGSLAEGPSASRWKDFAQLIRRGYRDNSLTVRTSHLGAHTRGFLERLGKKIHTALESALAMDVRAYTDPVEGLERLWNISLDHQCPEADAASDGLFFFGAEVFHEAQSRAALVRGSACLKVLFQTALARLHSLSTRQLHLLVYLTVQFALYGLPEQALPALEPALAKLLRVPGLSVDPPTGAVFSFLRKISTAPFKMLSFAEDETEKADTSEESLPERAISAPASAFPGGEVAVAEDGEEDDALGGVSARSDPGPENPPPSDPGAVQRLPSSTIHNHHHRDEVDQDLPLLPQIELAFEVSSLAAFLRALVAKWQQPQPSEVLELVSACGRSPEAAEAASAEVTAASLRLCLGYLSSLFLSFRSGTGSAASRVAKEQDLPCWPEPPAWPSIGAPQPLQLPKRALALNVMDGYETLRISLRLLLATLGKVGPAVQLPLDVAAVQELSVCTHVGLFHTLRRSDLGERTLRLGIISTFQAATIFLTAEMEGGPVVSLGWPIKLLEVLVKRQEAEPQFLVPVARLNLEAIRMFVNEVSSRRTMSFPELWRTLVHFLLRSVPTSSRALWPGTRDKEVETVQLMLWRLGIVWLLGHPDLADSQAAAAERGGPADTDAASFWSWALGELTSLAQEMSGGNRQGSLRLLVDAYRLLLGHLARGLSAEDYAREESPGRTAEAPETSPNASPKLRSEAAQDWSASSGSPMSNTRISQRAAAWSRVAIAMLVQAAPELSQRSSEDAVQLMSALRSTLLNPRVAQLFGSAAFGSHWSRQVLEKMVTELTRAVTNNAPLQVVRQAFPLVAKYFLQHLPCLQGHECFGQLWLMVLRLMLQCIKRGTEEKNSELEETAAEALKNLLCVLLDAGLLGLLPPKGPQGAPAETASLRNVPPVWWQMTWDCIEFFQPGYGVEFTKAILPKEAPANSSEDGKVVCEEPVAAAASAAST